MLINFFLTLRKYKVPATIRELLDLIDAIDTGWCTRALMTSIS